MERMVDWLSKKDQAILACPDIMALVDRRCIPEPNSGCWIWEGHIDEKGYAVYAAKVGERPISFRVPRAVLTHKLGYAPGVTRHTCDIPCCCNPDHLVDGDWTDNRIDYAQRGFGRERKLRYADAIAIRASKETRAVLAMRYGVSLSMISMIKTGRKWGHLASEIFNPKREYKLTAAEATAIRHAEGQHEDIAKAYGVSRQHVGDIKSGRRRLSKA